MNKQQVLLLEELLLKAKEAYYNKGAYYKVERKYRDLQEYVKVGTTVTDAIYDDLETELKAVKPKSVALRTGIKLKKNKMRLPFYMASLDKVKDAVALNAWLNSHPGPYVVSDKLDGVSIGLDYTDVDNLKAFTRGDGTSGGDISFMAQALGVPKRAKGLQVRGEVLLPLSKWKKYENEFSNPRNFVSGITNRDGLHTGLKDCIVYAYTIVNSKQKPSANLAKLKSLGFAVVPYTVVNELSFEKLTVMMQKRRSKQTHELDGLVIYQDVPLKNSISNPTTAIAFKNNTLEEQARVVVKEVEWNVTRTGLLFPRIVLNPVQVGGVTVSFCSGKSAEYIKTNKIGPGTVLMISRSGDVIPEIRKIVKATGAQLPRKQDFGHIELKGANYYIGKGNTQHDTTQASQKIAAFFNILGIDDFRLATATKFVSEGVDTILAVLKMTKKQFLSVPGTSPVVLQKVWDALQGKLQDIDLAEIMYASQVFGRSFGLRRFKAIIEGVPDLLTIRSKDVMYQSVVSLTGFNDTTANQFIDGLPEFKRWLKASGIKPSLHAKIVKLSSRKFEGQRYIFTGFRDASLEDYIVKNGGEIVTSIKKATVLLCKDPNSSSSKMNEARNLGIKIMTPQEFKPV